jgi:ABC-type bacteriocin/lantibiotic exporter with double-glycine peptidase domain/CRP-like cAMP-binding protein
LAALPLLTGLPAAVRDLVVDCFVPFEFAFGDEIVRQGDPSDGFYVIVRGRARPIRVEGDTEVPLGTLGEGDSFGEIGLLDGTPRNSTVRASAPTLVMKLDGALFTAIMRRHPEVQERLLAQARARKLAPLLRGHTVFAALPAEALDALASELEELHVLAGDLVIEEGAPPGPLLLVVEGRLRAWNQASGNLRYLRAGDLVGEVSLLTGTNRTATVEAVSDARLVALNADVFAHFIDAYPLLGERVEQQIALYARGPARSVPLDFASELPPESAPRGDDAAVSATEAAERPGLGLERRRAPLPRIGGRRKHVPHVMQVDNSDCGPACLSMLCRKFGHPVPISHLRDVCGTATGGTSLAGIARGGAAIGLDVQGLKVSKDRLGEIRLPAIIHVRGEHWVIVDEVRGDRVHVADPALGRSWVDREELLNDWSGFAALVTATDALNDAPDDSPSVRWLWPFFKPHLRALGGVVLLALLASALQMLVPVVTGKIINTVIGSQDRTRVYVLAGVLIGLQIIALIAGLARSRIVGRVTIEIDRGTLDHVAGRLFALPLSYFESRANVDVERRLDGMRDVRRFAAHQGVQAIADLSQLVVTVVLMGFLSPLLMLVWLATLPVYVLVLRFGAGYMRPAYRASEEAFNRYRARRMDVIRGIETVKTMGAETGLRRRLRGDFDDLAKRLLKADVAANDYFAMSGFATFGLLGLFLLLGALQVLDGKLSIGSLVAFNSLAALAAAPLLALLELWDGWQNLTVVLSRMRDIVDREPEQPEEDALTHVSSLEGRVTLKGVGFRYDATPDIAILQGIDVDIAPGTTVAIVGRSGSGKSTLLKCIAGLLAVTEGTISFDSVDMRTLRWVDLRRRIGLVPQRPHVFNDTIAANIAFTEMTPDIDAVRRAAEIADADGFIQGLTLGYATRVGESGLQLSGGQSQRLTIARAIYHRPPVLLLDEATAALDAEAERAVTENMRRLLEGRTAFIVAHRLSTVRDADLIIVLEQGRIAETGSHDELIARGGLYFHLYGQQIASD